MPVSLSEGSDEVGEMRAMRQILHEICRINQLNLGKVWWCPNGKNTVKHGKNTMAKHAGFYKGKQGISDF